MAILVIADVLEDTLLPSTLNTLTAARDVASHNGADVHLLLVGDEFNEATKAASRLPVGKVLTATSAVLADRNAEGVAKTVLAVAQRGYTHVLFSTSSFGKSVAPRVAAKLDVAQFSDITAVKGEALFERPTYAGNIIATVEALDAVKVITVRPTAFDRTQNTDAAVAVEACSAVADRRYARVTERHSEVSDRPDLGSAKIIVSGGRGLGSKENYDRVLTPLADKLGAALGASRAAVDAGFAPNDRQVGQTGKVVAPELYVAIGLSGAIQHLAGMRDSKIIVAVNSDPDAPIFGVADYGLVADLFTAVPQWLDAQQGS